MNDQASGAFLLCLVPGLLIGFPTLLILLTALAPGFFARARRVVSAHPWQSFLLGLINFCFFFAIAAVFSESAVVPLKVVAGLVVLAVLPLMVVVGAAAAAGIAGERLLAFLFERPGTPLATLVLGLIGLGLVGLLPILGWLILAILLMIGFGASLLALFRRSL